MVEAHIIDERSEWRTFSDKVGVNKIRMFKCRFLLCLPFLLTTTYGAGRYLLGERAACIHMCYMTNMQDKESADPNRVGGPTNHLLEGGGLSTVIGKGRDGDSSYMLNKLHTRRYAHISFVRNAGTKLCQCCHHFTIEDNCL